MTRDRIPDEQLCGYADQRLDDATRERIAARLPDEPELAARLADWRAQNGALHAAFDPVLDEPVPQRLIDAASARPRKHRKPLLGRIPWHRAAVLGWLAIGMIAGYALRDRSADDAVPSEAAAALPRQAAIAHAVFVPEVRHPVEVGADQQSHLVGWLSKRLGTQVQAPELAAQGYTLMGGRLLPGAHGPGAQFMYQRETGQRLTLYLSRSEPGGDTAFRFAELEGLSVFYWVDGGTGYALSAPLAREALLGIATVVHQQLNP